MEREEGKSKSCVLRKDTEHSASWESGSSRPVDETGQLHTTFLHFKTESTADTRTSRSREINVETDVTSCSHKRPGYTYRAFLMTVI